LWILAYDVLPGSFPTEIKILSSMGSLELTADIIDGGPPIVFPQLPNLETYKVIPSNSTRIPAAGGQPDANAASGAPRFSTAVARLLVSAMLTMGLAAVTTG